jgi:hypothetical protein
VWPTLRVFAAASFRSLYGAVSPDKGDRLLQRITAAEHIFSIQALKECTNGSAATFDQARAGFEAAWRVFLAKRTEADFQAWRDARDWTARKYAMWERGERLPSQKPSSLMTCPCGEVFDSHRPEQTLVHVPHITAAQA